MMFSFILLIFCVQALTSIPLQIAEVNRPYEYNLSANDLFGQPVKEVGLKQVDGSALPDWLKVSPTLISSYRSPWGGDLYQILIDGPYTYLATSNRLIILNWSNLTFPQMVSFYNTPNTLRTISLKNNNICLGGDFGFQVVDITNITNPQLLGSSDPGDINKLVFDGTYLYLSLSGYKILKIFNLSIPIQPTIIDTYNLPSYINDIIIDSDRDLMYLAIGSYGVHIYDLDNINNITLINTYDSTGSAVGFSINDNYLYLSDSSKLLSIDISDPYNLTLLSSYNLVGTYYLTCTGHKVYIATGNTGLITFDYTIPKHLVPISVYKTGGFTYQPVVHNNLVFIVDSTQDQIFVIDTGQLYLSGIPVISHIWSQLTVDAVTFDKYPIATGFDLVTDIAPISILSISDHSLSLDDQKEIYLKPHRFFEDDDQYETFNLFFNKNPNASWIKTHVNPVIINTVKITGNTYNVIVKGLIAYIATTYGLVIIDVSNVQQPVIRSQLNTTLTYKIVIQDSIAYLAASTTGLVIVNVTNIDSPQLITTYKTLGNVYDLEVVGHVVYVVDTVGLQVIDISVPNNPYLMATYELFGLGTPYGLVISGCWAYIVIYSHSIQILDISNPLKINYVNQYNSAIVRCVSVRDHLMFVGDGVMLKMINASNPNVLSIIGECITPNEILQVAVYGNMVYVSDKSDGLIVVDIQNPKEPNIIGNYNTPGRTYATYVVNQYAYLADFLAGLQIIDLSQYQMTLTPLFSGNEGNYPITITAQDSIGLSVSTTMLIRVEGSPRVIAPLTPQVALIGQPFYYFIPQGTFWDPNNDLLVYQAYLYNQTTLPKFLTFNTNSATFWGTAQALDKGLYHIVIMANDRICPETPIDLELLVQYAPIVTQSIATQVIELNKTWVYRIPVQTFEDKDGDILTYKVMFLNGDPIPNWLSFDPITQNLIGYPAVTETLDLIVLVSDNHTGQATTDLTIIIETFPQVNVIPPMVIGVNQMFEISLRQYFSHPMDQTLHFEVNLGSNSNRGWFNFDPNLCFFKGIPLASDLGNYSIQIRCIDEVGGQVSVNWNLQVEYYPEIHTIISNKIIKVNQPFKINLPIDAFFDPEGDPLVYTLKTTQGSIPLWLHFNTTTLVLTGIASIGDQGSIELILEANDGFGSNSQKFNLLIKLNTVPVITNKIPVQYAKVEEQYEYIVTKDLFLDLDGDVLMYIANLGDSDIWLKFNDSTRTFSGKPRNIDAYIYRSRIYSISLSAYDDSNTSVEHVFELILHGPSLWEKLLNIVMTVCGVLATMFGYYKKRYLLWNLLHKKDYIRDNLIVPVKTDGQYYTVLYPTANIKSIEISIWQWRKYYSRLKCGFQKILDLPFLHCLIKQDYRHWSFPKGVSVYPLRWLYYDAEFNIIRIVRCGPSEADKGKRVKIKIITEDNHIVEQFEILVVKKQDDNDQTGIVMQTIK